MTTVAVSRFGFQRADTNVHSYSRGADCVRAIWKRTALETEEGAGKAGCPPHPWPACNKKARGRTTGVAGIIRPSLRNGFNGVLRALPGDEFLLSPSPRGLNGFTRPVGPTKPPRDLTPATGARTTRLHRPHQCRSSGAPRSLTIKSPCDSQLRARHCRVHRIPSQRS
jgi:hypothetical protein